jgi:hypothetical protein
MCNVVNVVSSLSEVQSNTVDGWIGKECDLGDPIRGGRDDLVWMDFLSHVGMRIKHRLYIQEGGGREGGPYPI